jgi:hypothetical protein
MYSESTGNKNQILVGSTSPSKGEVFKKKNPRCQIVPMDKI